MTMIRRFTCIVLAIAVTGLIGGCDKPPVSTNTDMPVKSGQGVDKKGNKSKTAEVSLEDPNYRK
jgi:hypothetical protein